MATRREFLKGAGGGAVVLQSGGIIEWSEAPFPPYPSIPKSELNRLGWSRKNRDEKELDGAKWRFSYYEWDRLRHTVKEATDDLIDMPLGGLLAFRIGNDGTTLKLNGDVKIRGETFTGPNWAAARLLSDSIDDQINSYIRDFAEGGIEKLGELNWSLYNLGSGPGLGTYAKLCEAGGTLTTEIDGSHDMVQHNLEYQLRRDTVNEHREVYLEQTHELDFIGWSVDFVFDETIYGIAAIHPKATGDYCGLTDPHIERVLSDVIDEEIDLGLEAPLYGKVRSIMSAVR